MTSSIYLTKSQYVKTNISESTHIADSVVLPFIFQRTLVHCNKNHFSNRVFFSLYNHLKSPKIAAILTTQPKAALMKLKTLASSGADPVITIFTLPPSNFCTLPKTSLSQMLSFLTIKLEK